MGCTHYPILADDIQTFFGPDIRLVHSGEAMWEMLKESERALPRASTPKRGYLATDTGSRVRQLAERFMGISIEAVEHIDLV